MAMSPSCFTNALPKWMVYAVGISFLIRQGSSISQSGHVKALMAMTLSLPVTSFRARKEMKV